VFPTLLLANPCRCCRFFPRFPIARTVALFGRTCLTRVFSSAAVRCLAVQLPVSGFFSRLFLVPSLSRLKLFFRPSCFFSNNNRRPPTPPTLATTQPTTPTTRSPPPDSFQKRGCAGAAIPPRQGRISQSGTLTGRLRSAYRDYQGRSLQFPPSPFPGVGPPPSPPSFPSGKLSQHVILCTECAHFRVYVKATRCF